MNYSDNYYTRTKSYELNSSKLNESIQCDVCIVGGGLTGISTAYYLSNLDPSLKIVVLEKNRIGWGASGRNGGQLLHGYSSNTFSGQKNISEQDERVLWDFSVDAVKEVKKNIKKHNIDCDLIEGFLLTAASNRHERSLHQYQSELEKKYNYKDSEFLNKQELNEKFRTPYYQSAVYDRICSQIHPLNYCLGLAKEALKNQNLSIYEYVEVSSYISDSKVQIKTSKNIIITANNLVLSCNAYIGNLSKVLRPNIMPVKTYVTALEALPDKTLKEFFEKPIAISDMFFVLNYFRLNSHNNLIFGGRVSYSNVDPIDVEKSLKNIIKKIMPGLEKYESICSWSGHVAITQNRLPHIGRLDPNIIFAQGYSGHGVALTTLVGKVLAQTIRGQTAYFDLFSKITHSKFPGAGILDTPLLVLAMSYYKLRDMLGLY